MKAFDYYVKEKVNEMGWFEIYESLLCDHCNYRCLFKEERRCSISMYIIVNIIIKESILNIKKFNNKTHNNEKCLTFIVIYDKIPLFCL